MKSLRDEIRLRRMKFALRASCGVGFSDRSNIKTPEEIPSGAFLCNENHSGRMLLRACGTEFKFVPAHTEIST